MNPSAAVTRSGLPKTKLPDIVPFDNCQVPGSQFWCLFFEKLKKFDVKNFGGPPALGENKKKSKKGFFANKTYFFPTQSELYMFSAFI